MKHYLPLSLMLLLGFSSATNAQTLASNTFELNSVALEKKAATTTIKTDSLSDQTPKFTLSTHLGLNLGVFNFWEASRNLSKAVNAPIPTSRRFGIGFNYLVAGIVSNKHWVGANADLLINVERKELGYTTNSFAANLMLNYGYNIRSASSKTPIFPFVGFGLASTSLFLKSTDRIAASNLTTQFSSLNISCNHFAYKIGIASMKIGKKGKPTNVVQVGYLGGINSDEWISGDYAQIDGLDPFALKGVFFSMTY